MHITGTVEAQVVDKEKHGHPSPGSPGLDRCKGVASRGGELLPLPGAAHVHLLKKRDRLGFTVDPHFELIASQSFHELRLLINDRDGSLHQLCFYPYHFCGFSHGRQRLCLSFWWRQLLLTERRRRNERETQE